MISIITNFSVNDHSNYQGWKIQEKVSSKKKRRQNQDYKLHIKNLRPCKSSRKSKQQYRIFFSDLADHLMPQYLFFVENLDGDALSCLHALGKLHLGEGPLAERPAQLVLPNPRPPHRGHSFSPHQNNGRRQQEIPKSAASPEVKISSCYRAATLATSLWQRSSPPREWVWPSCGEIARRRSCYGRGRGAIVGLDTGSDEKNGIFIEKSDGKEAKRRRRTQSYRAS